MTFPSALDVFPKPGPDIQQDDVGFYHDVLHSGVAVGLEAIQSKVGINESEDEASLDYRVRRPKLETYQETVVDHGVVSGPVGVALGAGPIQRYELGGSISFSFSGLAPPGLSVTTLLVISTTAQQGASWSGITAWFGSGALLAAPEGISLVYISSIDGVGLVASATSQVT